MKINKLLLFILTVTILADIYYSQHLPWRNMGVDHADNLAVSSIGYIYASTNGNLFKSENDGETWTNILTNTNIKKIETLGTDSLLLGSEEGNLIFSPDGGESYNPIYFFGSDIYTIKFIDLGDSSVIAVGTANGYVHISSDFGQTWNSQQISTNYVTSIKYIGNRVFAATGMGLFYSDNYGQTWLNMIISVANEPVFDIEADSANNLYASADYDIYKSTDSGNTWTLSFDRLVFVIEYSPEGEIFAGKYRTLDQGLTWHEIIPTNVRDIGFRDSLTFVVAENDVLYSHIFVYREELNPYSGTKYLPLSVGNSWQYTIDQRSYDGIFTYISNYSLVTISVISDTLISGEEYFKVGNSDTVQYFKYSGDNKLYVWQNSTENVYMDFNLIWGETFSYFGYSSFIFEGYDINFGKERYHKGHRFGPLDDRTTREYIDSIGLWTDSYYTGGPLGSYFIRDQELIDALILEDISFNYYSNYLQPEIQFTPISTVDTLKLSLNFNVIHPHSKFSSSGSSRNFIKDVWIKYFYATPDSSTSSDCIFCNITELSAFCTVSIPLDSMKFAQGFKFYYAIYAMDKALSPQFVRSPDMNYYELTYSPDPNSIENENNRMMSFKLSQNYPNPFNPTTKIKYQIPKSGYITLKVYDVLGNEISTLANEEKPAGEYEVEFDGSNLPSGIYFYKLQAGEFVETKKMVLLK